MKMRLGNEGEYLRRTGGEDSYPRGIRDFEIRFEV